MKKNGLIVLIILFIAIFFISKNFRSDVTTSIHLLKVGTNAEFAPFSFIKDAKIVGFDIDVITEVAKRLNKEIEFIDSPFDALIPALVTKKIDVIAAGLTITEERAKRVLFSTPFLEGDPLYIVTLASFPEPVILNDLTESKIVVNEGFTADTYLTQNTKFKNPTRLTTISDGFIALKAGRADAFITAKSTFDTFAKEQNPKDYKLTPIDFPAETSAFAFSSDSTELKKSVDDALDLMKKDGTLEGIQKKWGFNK